MDITAMRVPTVSITVTGITVYPKALEDNNFNEFCCFLNSHENFHYRKLDEYIAICGGQPIHKIFNTKISFSREIQQTTKIFSP